MASLAIGRLKNRLSAPEIADAWAAAPVLDLAVRRLPDVLDDLLPEILDAAGLPADAVVALRRLDVRLTMGSEPDRFVHDWAFAIGAALREAIGAAASRPASRGGAASPEMGANGIAASGQDPGDGAPVPDMPEAVVFPDRWSGEAEVLRLLAKGEALPWWVEAVTPGPVSAASAIGEWIERDPARAAAALMELTRAGFDIAALLSPAVAAWFVGRLLERLAAAQPGGSGRAAVRGETAETSIGRAWRMLSATERAVLAAIPEERRALFVLAALMTRVPAAALHVAARAAERETRAAVLALLARPGPAEMRELAPETAEAPIPRPAGVAVMHGGLLLLCRPLAVLGVIGQIPAADVADTLLGIGLLALRRVSRTLSPAARRVVLERDRALLTVFAGAPPPDSPLDTLPIPETSEPWLNAVLDVAPRETGWAAGAERRYFGGPDPFGETPDGLLARILLRPGRLVWTPFSADLTWPAADIALRRAGWDIDPGWMPWIGRVVRFHYDDTVEP